MKHHTSLHAALTQKKETCLTSISLLTNLKDTILGTVSIVIFDKTNEPTVARALLDPGSQRNFMTNKLILVKQSESLDILGIGKTSSYTLSQSVNAVIKSSSSNYQQAIKFSLMEDVIESLPQDFKNN